MYNYVNHKRVLVTVTPKLGTFVSPRKVPLHVCGNFGNPEEGHRGKGPLLIKETY